MKTNTSIKVSIVAVIFSFGLLSANESHAQLKAGGGLAFGTNFERLGIQVNANYEIPDNEEFRVAADFIYYFPESPSSGVSQRWSEFNINGNYIFFENDETSVYGLAGLNYMTYSVDYQESWFGTGSGSWTSLNLGVGGEYDVDFGALFGELKFVTGFFSRAVLSAGVRIPIDI